MDSNKFDEKIKDFTPPWIRNGYNVYCPLYMKPKDGYIGRVMLENEHWDMVWKDMQQYKNVYSYEQLLEKSKKINESRNR